MSTMTAIVKDDPVASLRKGLLAYWSFDSYTGWNWDAGGHMAMYVGTPVTGTGTISALAGNAPAVTGRVGKALQFNGTSQYVWLPDATDLRLPANGSFTLAAWVNPTALPASGALAGIISKNQDATHREFLLDLDSGGGVQKIDFNIYNASNTTVGSINFVTTLPLNTWTLMVAWYDAVGATLNLQLNNGTVTSSAVTGTPNPGTTSNLEIGRDLSTRYFHGALDGVGIWKRVLSAAERRALYNGGAGRNAMRAHGETGAGRGYDATKTVRFIGDIHYNNTYNPYGSSSLNGQQLALDAIAADTTPVAATVQMGDLVDIYVVADRTDDQHMQAWLSGFTGTSYCIAGNHDIKNYTTNDTRSGTQWATDVGLPAKDQVINLGFATLVLATCDTVDAANGGRLTFNSTTLAWLDTTIGGISGDVILVTHPILTNTVLSPPAGMSTAWDSTIAAMQVAPDASMRTLLTNHANIVAWISGHSHSPLNAVNLVTTQTFGSNNVLFVNASAVGYQAAGPNAGQIYTFYLPTLYFSIFPDRFEVRWRDHGTQEWINPTGQWVTTVTR